MRCYVDPAPRVKLFLPPPARSCALLAVLGALPAQSALPLVDEGTRIPSEARDGVQTLVADLNGDGYPDLIHLESQRIQTWIQEKETGRFLVKATLVPTLGTVTLVRGATGLLAGGDAFVDLVIAVSTGNLLLMRGDGSGGLVPQPGVFPTLGTTVPTQILVGNFDRVLGDDLLLLYDAQKALLLTATATGVFANSTASAPLPQLGGPQGALVDFNGDGYPDLVLTSTTAGVALAIANLTGSLATNPISLAPTALPPIARIAVGDVNGDGRADLVFGPLGGTATVTPLVFLATGQASTPFVQGPVGPFAVSGFKELVLADLARRGIQDLVVETGDGSVYLGFNLGGGTFTQPANPLLDAAPRGSLIAVDFDKDQDVDLFVDGAGTEPVYLLGAGPARWTGSERDAFPIGATTRGLAASALVDANGDGDPDVVVLDPGGQANDLYRNDGQGRFLAPTAGPLPALPVGSSYSRIVPIALRVAGLARDLVVLGTATGVNASGARMLVAQSGGGYLDETATRWPAGTVGSVAIAAGPLATSASQIATEVVVGDGTGKLTHLHADPPTGKLVVVPNSLTGLVVPNLTFLAIGSLDGDPLNDLVAIDTIGRVLVWPGTAIGAFGANTLAITTLHPARQGVIGDFDGDGRGDLLLVTPNANLGLTLLMGKASGGFQDASATWLPTRIPANIVALERVGTDVVIGAAGSPVMLMRVGAGAFTNPVALPTRGSTKVFDLLSGDVDLDGDTDVVALRSTAHPLLLRGSALALTQLGVCQGGRSLGLRFRGPPAGFAFLFFGPTQARFVIPPYGVLRLASLTQLLSLPLPGSGTALPGVTDLFLQVPPVSADLILPMQAAFFDPGNFSVVLSNLENVRVVDF